MTKRARILLAEDDAAVRRVMAFHLVEAGFKVDVASDGAEALAMYSPGRHAAVVTDIRMPTMDGIELIGELRHRDPTVAVLVVTAFGNVDRAIEAMQRGAFHYVEKPVNLPAFIALVRTAVQHSELRRENQQLKKAPAQTLVAASPAMNEVLRLVDRVADSDATILIEGESGTGKELIAQEIHQRSNRADRAFVAINCAAIPEDLLESTLFGHEAGAFTGATKAVPGKFVLADDGTVFLDEIGEMSPGLQAKLLRVLQTGEVEVVGGGKSRHVDVRVLAATHRDLRAGVKEGSFREDLYYRLAVVPIRIPPLRDRPEDIPVLTRFFIRNYASELVRVTPGVDAAFAAYDWPGNVRELENTVKRMLLLREGDELAEGDLPRAVVDAAEPDGLPFDLPRDRLDLFELERKVIFAALAKHDGNQSATARYLNIPRHVLLYRLEKFAEDSGQ